MLLRLSGSFPDLLSAPPALLHALPRSLSLSLATLARLLVRDGCNPLRTSGCDGTAAAAAAAADPPSSLALSQVHALASERASGERMMIAILILMMMSLSLLPRPCDLSSPNLLARSPDAEARALASFTVTAIARQTRSSKLAREAQSDKEIERTREETRATGAGGKRQEVTHAASLRLERRRREKERISLPLLLDLSLRERETEDERSVNSERRDE